MAEHQSELSVRQAGRRGGLALLQRRGRSFFAQIGRKGQLELRQKHPGMASVWGKLGGRPRKPSLTSTGEESNSM